MSNIETCPKCKRDYQVEEQLVGMNVGCKEPEEIFCPYSDCDHYHTRRSNGVWKTYPIEKD